MITFTIIIIYHLSFIIYHLSLSLSLSLQVSLFSHIDGVFLRVSDVLQPASRPPLPEQVRLQLFSSYFCYGAVLLNWYFQIQELVPNKLECFCVKQVVLFVLNILIQAIADLLLLEEILHKLGCIKPYK